ncbi:MAG: HdaA/DnaA family protein [Panacagrimonas sp.]
MKGEQLALGVQLSQAPGFDNFFSGPNAETCAALRRMAQGRGLIAACVVGAQASGKTHLLHATVAAAAEGSAYRSLRDARGVDLRDVGEAPLLALDDVDAVDDESAIALLRWVDTRRARRLPLLVSCTVAPLHLDALLPDLRTRLSAMALLSLKPLHDPDRHELLRMLATERGLELPDEVARWLLAHLPRDAGTLIATLDQLDRAALSLQRRLSVPFVQHVLLRAPAP